MTSPQRVRDQRSEAGSQKSEDRSQEQEVGNQESGVGSQNREVGSAMSDVRSQAERTPLIERAYSRGVGEHGDLDFALEDFAAQVNSIITRRLGEGPEQEAVNRFVASLHAEDLYLAAACVHNSQLAWSRFAARYDKHIDNVAHFVCSTHQEARELASSLLAHLFFHDRSGRSRIASYEGRGSLSTWLATIIKHQAINQRQLKSFEAVPLDSLCDTASAFGTSELEAALLRNKYREAIADSFKAAAKKLAARERLVLVLRFEEEMAALEIAQLIGVHPSQITRTVKQAQVKLRTMVLTRLSAHHGLGAQAMDECSSAIGDFDTSVIAYLKS